MPIPALVASSPRPVAIVLNGVGLPRNYFPAKEDLVYGRLEAFEQELLDAIRGRAPSAALVVRAAAACSG